MRPKKYIQSREERDRRLLMEVKLIPNVITPSTKSPQRPLEKDFGFQWLAVRKGLCA
jgi:hypothetical protein